MRRAALPIVGRCHRRWDDLVGDARVRYCAECAHDVVNLSALSEREALALVAQARAADTQLCARYRSVDGEIQFAADGRRRVSGAVAAGVAVALLAGTGHADLTPPRAEDAPAERGAAPRAKPTPPKPAPRAVRPKARPKPPPPAPDSDDDMGRLGLRF